MKKKSKWITEGLPMQPNPNTPVSVSVIVKTDGSRILMAYYDFDRGTWYVTGAMSGENVVSWQYLPE
jgi:hypothetical protein